MVLKNFRFLRKTEAKVVLLIFCIYMVYSFFSDDFDENLDKLPSYESRNDHKAFITSAYFYPKSKSLGDNSLALVMSMTGNKKRKGWMTIEQWDYLNTPLITVKAENETNSIIVKTKYKRIIPHEECQIISIFASFTLLPNIKTISMVGENNELVEIPFQIPSSTPHDVVICINPVFLSDQWQNFIFMAHLYKKFEGFVNLYFISAIDSIYHLMREYEKEGYLRIQLWPSVKFRGVLENVIDPYNEIEYENRASASTDCLLQYKETAQFLTFLDLNDLLIPTHGPTFLKEFQSAVWSWRNTVYVHYRQEEYEMLTVRDAQKFSFTKMFKLLKNKNKIRTGQIVANPKLMNYTWMHGQLSIPKGYRWVSTSKQSITHVKVKWIPEYNENIQPRMYNASLDNYMDTITLQKIDGDIQKMFAKPGISTILPNLPKYHHFKDALQQCYFYNITLASKPICPGPQVCHIPQLDSVNCIHVNATYEEVSTMKPITYYYATNPKVVLEEGCHPPH